MMKKATIKMYHLDPLDPLACYGDFAEIWKWRRVFRAEERAFFVLGKTCRI